MPCKQASTNIARCDDYTFICITDNDFNCLSFCRSSACQGHKYPPTSANSHIKYAWSRKFSQTITVHPNPPQSYNQFIRAKHFRYTDIVKARYPQYFCPSNNKDAESNLNRVRIFIRFRLGLHFIRVGILEMYFFMPGQKVDACAACTNLFPYYYFTHPTRMHYISNNIYAHETFFKNLQLYTHLYQWSPLCRK